MELELKAELEEAEKLAKMSEAERVKAKAEKERIKFEKERKKFEEEMRAFNQERMLNTTMTTLSEKNLPVEFASFLRADNAEQIMENIAIFDKHFNEAVEKVVLERLRGKTPQTGTTTKNFDMNELKNMSAAEINANWNKIKNNLR
jgi:methionyl-tRNA formyltransferase